MQLYNRLIKMHRNWHKYNKVQRGVCARYTTRAILYLYPELNEKYIKQLDKMMLRFELWTELEGMHHENNWKKW
jgi:hypothetical protein